MEPFEKPLKWLAYGTNSATHDLSRGLINEQLIKNRFNGFLQHWVLQRILMFTLLIKIPNHWNNFYISLSKTLQIKTSSFRDFAAKELGYELFNDII